MRCVCGAPATYRLSRGAQERYRCAACANAYPAPDWKAELMPVFQRDPVEDAYRHYVELRQRVPAVAPADLGRLPGFEAWEAFEARWQRQQRGYAA
jgi:hypothetical protein